MIKNKPKILFFDIETTHLKADFGTLLCVGYRWLGEKKVHVPSVLDYPEWKKDPTNDKGITKEFFSVLQEADLIVSYFGKGFDMKYLTAKGLEHGLPILPNIPHVDLFFTVKANLALSRKSLQNVGYFLNLSAEKTPVEGRIWKKAATGHAPSVKYIVDHCKADVLLLEEAYLKLRPLVRQHPRVGEYGACKTCGSFNLQLRGRALTVTKGPRQRVCCKECGSWETRPVLI